MTGRPCRENVPESIWPGRTVALVERERRYYPEAVSDVVTDNVTRGRVVEIDPQNRKGTPELLDDQLIAVLSDETPLRAAAAAFVAGRCTTDDAEADAAIVAGVVALVAGVDTSQRLGRRARPYVEALMAMALLGRVDEARSRLEAIFAEPSRRSVADHLAAGYLAQIGSPLGYPALLEDLHDRDSAQVREFAVDQLIAFLPYDGQRVGDATVDIRGELRKALRDKDSDVGVSAVAIIAGADIDNADALLREASERPHPKDVRETAKAVLKQRSAS